MFESTYSIPLMEFYVLFIKPPYSYRSFALGSVATLTCVVFFNAAVDSGNLTMMQRERVNKNK